jgi:hypothetical protein
MMLNGRHQDDHFLEIRVGVSDISVQQCVPFPANLLSWERHALHEPPIQTSTAKKNCAVQERLAGCHKEPLPTV